MPEPYRPKRGLQPYMLSSAVRDGCLVETKCVGCSPARWYRPEDMVKLFGDIPAVNLERVMRCEKCSSNLYVSVTVPLPEVRAKIRIRRIDRIWWVKRVSWKYEG